MPATTIDKLTEEFTSRLGEGRFTAAELVRELASSERGDVVALLSALDDALGRIAAGDPDAAAIDPALWGPEPLEGELIEAHRRGQQALDAALARALDGALNRDEVAALLGVTPQAVSKRLAGGSLVALKRGRAFRFPAWQFGDGEVVPGVRELAASHPGSALALTTWATTPSPDLDGRTPAAVLRTKGGIERVVQAARALGAAAW